MVSETIYQMVLDYLHVTYTPDESTERRIMAETASGIAHIKKYCNPEAECNPGTLYGQLLCDYVMRAEAGATETFDKDFAEEILAAKMETDAKGYAEAMGYE